MKPDYKNWVPKGMLMGLFTGTIALGILWLIVFKGSFLSGIGRIAVEIILGILFIVTLVYAVFCLNLYRSVSYDGKKQLSQRIINRLSDYVVLPDRGIGLDVGCGSGALTIACAKKNPQASMIGLDRWGKEYASFTKTLCENNAKAEGVNENTHFVEGNARQLDFPDAFFDVVTSNYCYHNIPSRDRQAIILESLRVLKKGGTFAIHDWFVKGKYGDFSQLINKLQDMGYEKVELLATDDGLFLTKKEARPLCLTGSALLIGKK